MDDLENLRETVLARQLDGGCSYWGCASNQTLKAEWAAPAPKIGQTVTAGPSGGSRAGGQFVDLRLRRCGQILPRSRQSRYDNPDRRILTPISNIGNPDRHLPAAVSLTRELHNHLINQDVTIRIVVS